MRKILFGLLLILLTASLLIAGCQETKKSDEESSIKNDPGSSGKTFDEVNIVTEDGLNLKGRLYGFGKKGVVLSHMFPSDQNSWNDFASELTEKGYIVLTLDFRGYGDSDGEKNPAKIDLDEKAAIEFIKDQGVEELFLIGASMGGTAALKTSSIAGVNGVVSLSAPRAFRGLSVEKEITTIKKPKLFIAAEGDEEAVKEAEWLFDSTQEPKELEIVGGSDHGSDLISGEEGKKVKRSITDFLESDA